MVNFFIAKTVGLIVKIYKIVVFFDNFMYNTFIIPNISGGEFFYEE